MSKQQCTHSFVAAAIWNTCLPTPRIGWRQVPSRVQPLLRLVLVVVLVLLGWTGGRLTAAAEGLPSKPLATAYDCSEAGLDAAIAAGGTATFTAVPCYISLTTTKTIGKDLTIDGGTYGGYGLSLYSSGQRVLAVPAGVHFTLKNTAINNATTTDLAGGSAILINGGSVTVDHDQFLSNTAPAGGALRVINNGSLEVVNSTFSSNKADGGDGGAIDIVAGSTTILSSTFTLNTGTFSGGAISSGSPLTITASSFIENSALTGGAVIASPDTTLRVQSTTFTANHALGAGGGISTQGELDVVNSSFISNTTTVDGGGIFGGVGSRLTIAKSLLQENQGNGSDAAGGGIAAFGPVTVTQSTIISNTAAGGGGVATAPTVVFSTSDSTFTGNRAITLYGGAIYSVGPLIVTNGSLTGNTAQSSGGAIFQGPDLPMTLQASTFTGNHSDGDGGAVAAQGQLTVNTSTFTENTAQNSGGGIISINGPATINSSTFLSNTAAMAYGGGIYFASGGGATVDQSTFRGNTAQTYGGAVMSAIPVQITDGTFTHNTGGIAGGAIAALDTSLSVRTTAMTANTAPVGSGLYSIGTLILTTSSLVNNSANPTGGALYTRPGTGTATVQNTTIGQNTGTGIAGLGSGIQISNSTIAKNDAATYAISITTTMQLKNSIVSGTCAGAGTTASQGSNLGTSTTCGLTQASDRVLDEAALQLGALTTAGNGTSVYPLLGGSPARDAIDPATCPSTDQRGIARPQGSRCDTGAYEAMAGVSLIPTTTLLAGVPYQTVTASLSLTNVGPTVPDAYTITLAGQTWTTTVSPTTTVPLAVGGSIMLTVKVTIPPDALPGQTSTVTVTARSNTYPEQTATAQITTGVLGRQGALPVAMRAAASGW